MAPPGLGGRSDLLGHKKGDELLGHKKYKNCKHLNEHMKVNDDNLVVMTKNGKVEGIRETAANGCPVDMWWGIPFAEPPVGELRFKKPVPISK